MADLPRSVVHVDTPRPGPKRRISIRLHPEMRWRQRGGRVQKSSKVPPPLVDWSSEDQQELHNEPAENMSSGDNKNIKTFSHIFGNLQREALEEKVINEDGVKFTEKALRSHDEDDLADHRASESDEESSSSKRSREDMEDGLEEGTTSQLKKSKVDCGSLNVQCSFDGNQDAHSGSTFDLEDDGRVDKVTSSGNVEDNDNGKSSERTEASVDEGMLVERMENDGDAETHGVPHMDDGRVRDGAKRAGFHRALQKQLDDRRKHKAPSAAPHIGRIIPEYDDSTEESEEEKETWSKMVESLTRDVGELESVQSLSSQLENTIARPPSVPLPQQPSFVHPWGLFPFQPMEAFSPYPVIPCWMPPPVFYPFPQPLRPRIRMLPSTSRNESADAIHAQAPTVGSIHNRENTGTVSPPGIHYSVSPKTQREFQNPEALQPTSSNASDKSMSEEVTNDSQESSSSDTEEADKLMKEQSNVKDGCISSQGITSSQRHRKVYVPLKIKQMTKGRCHISGNFQENEKGKTRKEASSLVGLMQQETETDAISSPLATESSPKTPLRDDKAPTVSDAYPKHEESGLIWRRSWRDMAMSSAPPALSTVKMQRADCTSSSPDTSTPCSGNRQWESLYSNRVLTSNSYANTPKAQLVARIQPRRRITLQNEVMMTSVPKVFHQQLPFSSSSERPDQVVYPWSNVEYIDTHCHIDFLYQRLGCTGTFEKFSRVRGFPDNYGGCVAVFCTPESFHPTNDIWQNLLKEDKVWGAFGCHPHHVKSYDGNVETHIMTGMMHQKAVAFGEIGLDYSNRNCADHVLQHMVFRRQLAMALHLQKPLVIHSREAESDTLDIMVQMVPRDYKIHRHCFTGPPEEARTFLKAFPNSFIGITNLVTFPSAVEICQTAREIPLDKILLETDAPYFLPRQCPREMRWSHPAMAVFVAEKIARLRNVTTDEVLRQVRKNTRAMYGI